METTKLYLDDAQLDRFEGTVVDTDGEAVALDRTTFYPSGGGQPPDTGELRAGDRRWRVEAVRGREVVWHELDGAPPSTGTAITGNIDWARRHAHMRFHTAQHLLSAALLERYDAETTGNQLYADRARLDCAYERFDEADLAAIEEEVNAWIEDDRDVTAFELARDRADRELDPARTRLDLLPPSVDPVRIVEIEGLDRTACGGTHVSHTGAIGAMTITGRETAGAGEERIRFTLADA